MENTKIEQYKHFIAIDWSVEVVYIARMTAQSGRIITNKTMSSIKPIKEYLLGLRGRKILTIEETTGSHWLYVELNDYVDKIIICEPHRNKLLSEGPKNDKIDAGKLCMLLRSGMLKQVYHSLDEDYKIRKLVSAYISLVKAGVRIMNQRSALYRNEGLNSKKDKNKLRGDILRFIDEQQTRWIEQYCKEKESYEKKFEQIKNTNRVIKYLRGIPGIGTISAMKIYSRVIDADRFDNKYKYWNYCGLVKNNKESGGRNYGKKKPRYSRELKGVYKSSAFAAIGGKSDIREYYEVLLREGYQIEHAQNQIARYIAKASYAVMKNKEGYKAYQWRKSKESITEK